MKQIQRSFKTVRKVQYTEKPRGFLMLKKSTLVMPKDINGTRVGVSVFCFQI